jgi:hypothetical protein
MMRGRSARLYRAGGTRSASTSRTLFALGLVAFAPAALGDGPSEPAAFSSMRVGESLAPWTSVTIALGKKRTHYDLVMDGGHAVLHAVADGAASALAFPLHGDLGATPLLAWRWKIAAPIADADPAVAAQEDSPARIVLEFDGDIRRLPLMERSIYGIAEHVAGRRLPYATLMYIYANELPVGSVVPNPRTPRIQMIVAASGATQAGRWASETRNVRDDFRRAFGEEPGPLLAIGVLTDSDNTHAHAEAWYGDLRFEPVR